MMKYIRTIFLVSVMALGTAALDFGEVLALSEIDRHCVNNHCPNWSNEKDACAAGAAGVVGTLPNTVPGPFNAIFTDAAANGPHNNGKPGGHADPLLVASIYYIEHRGWLEPPPPYGNGKPYRESPAHAKGPFQFLDGTWKEHGRDLDGKNGADVQDLKEASYGAADFIFDIGGKQGIPLGNPSNPRSVRPSVVDTFASYNAGPNDPTPDSAEVRQYIQIGVKIYNQLKGGAPDAGSGATLGCNTGGGAGVSADGFVFPLRTTKPKMTNNAYYRPNCKNPVSSMGALGRVSQRKDLCHHDYLAADIQTPIGTEVLAVRNGRIIRTGRSNDKCIDGNMSLFSDTKLGGDGNTYYMAHLGSHKAKEGATPKAGEVIADVGNPGGCFQPHLHIDASPSQAGFGRGSHGTEGPLLDLQPALLAAYQNLPGG